MNKRNTIMLASAASVAILLGGSLAAQKSFAQEGATKTSLVELIASKFNLKKDEVQAVVDQFGQQKQAERQQSYEERLTQAVTDGKLTAAQNDLILAKEKEMQAKMEANRQLATEAERRAAMEQEKTDLKKWATDNTIDLKWLHPFGGRKGGGMKGDGVRMGSPDGEFPPTAAN